MKKLYFSIIALALTATAANAQTILDEDFETTSTESYSTPVAKGAGWETVNTYTGDRIDYKWANHYNEKGAMGGLHDACCDGAMFAGNDGFGPREEILLSPELDLNDTYQLSFDWKVSPNAYQPSTAYDLQIRIVEDGDVANAETIFSIQNEDDLKESGVMVYPITTWDINSSKINLSDWKGKKVRIAFVYKMLTTVANILYIDNVLVKQFTPATTPIPSLSLDRYNFGNVYIGEKFYSDIFILTNTGVNGLKIESVDLPAGVAMTIDPATVNLDKYTSVSFRFSYAASLTTPANANAVLHTNGGDVTVALSATKQVIPDGMTEETFEGYFPPAGWTTNGWIQSNGGFEGDHSAWGTGNLSDTYLVSPRLDLTKGGKITFFYHNQTNETDESEQYQGNDFIVELSTDGGETWTKKWTFDYTLGTYSETKTIDLGVGTDDSYVRWVDTAVNYDSESGADPYAEIYLDRVLLPTLYGADGVPDTTALVAPKNNLEDVYNKDIVLEWTPAQFAKGYKLYVGSNFEADNFINGMDLGNVLTYTIPTAAYATHYNWKVVPYNDKGDATNVPVWHFTTIPDASTNTYPYVADFSDGKVPNGWLSSKSQNYNRQWSIHESKGNPAPCLWISWLNSGDNAAITTSEFTLPTDKTMRISFDWNNFHPVDLVTDESGLAQKENMTPDNGVSKTTFEIGVDGTWTELSYISEDHKKENPYWINEKFDLSAYAGKAVQFRWTHYSMSGNDNGAALDNVVIEAVEGDKAEFNKEEWNAGKVNYDKAVNSGDIFTLLNKGTNDLTVKSVAFETSNFTTSIKENDVIAPNAGLTFNVQFNAKDAAAAVSDNMTVTFTSGYSVSLPVKGEALAQDVRYYSFEKNELDYDWTKDFTMIDVDKAPGYAFSASWIHFSMSGLPYAFAVGYDSEMYGIMSPVSGDAALVASGPDDVSSVMKADNWLISRKMLVGQDATVDFYARNWESLQSVMPSGMNKIGVCVSTGDPTDVSSFRVIMAQEEIPYLDGSNWKHYTVDLSSYAGRNVYVALHHTTEVQTYPCFFDDLTFTHFADEDPNGIESVSAISDNAQVSVYSINGVKVAEGVGVNTLRNVASGIYLVKMNDGDNVRTFRVVRK